jgi:putative phosphoribosyl transferase
MEGKFPNRAEAGRRLAERLTDYRGRSDAIVLGLPRGGVPVASEVAQRLGLPLDVFVVRKLGVPGFEELAMGAIASGDVVVLNDDVMRALPNSEAILESVRARETLELRRRETRYRQNRIVPDLRGRVVILVDDGLATGATMRAAAAALRKQQVAKIVVAVPVGAPETCREIELEVDEMVCPLRPEFFQGVGQFYEDFSQTSDEEVREILAKGRMTNDRLRTRTRTRTRTMTRTGTGTGQTSND